MKLRIPIIASIGGAGLFVAVMAFAAPPSKTGLEADIARNAQTMLDEGKFGFEHFESVHLIC